MRIGVVSDTHNNLRNVGRIVELLNGAAVERVVHTGDITQARTLEVLAGLTAPLVGVYGNNDQERRSLERAAVDLGIRLVDPPLRLAWARRRIVVVHDPEHLEPELLAEHDLALHGHTHRLAHQEREGAVVFNPGECAGMLEGRNAVGVVDLPRLDVELLRF